MKAWRNMTNEEKSIELWNRKGRPYLIWDSSKKGTFRRSNTDSVALMQRNIDERAEILGYKRD